MSVPRRWSFPSMRWWSSRRGEQTESVKVSSRVTKMAPRDALELREELDQLSPKEKAELARMLLDSLDESLDENVEQLWLDEAA